MSWYNPLSWKSKQPYQFTDAERRTSAETRQTIANTKVLEEQLKQQELRLESQARQLELKARIQEAQNILDSNNDDDDDSDIGDDSTSQMIGLLKMVINKNNNNPAPNNASEETSTHSQTGAGFYSDEQIQKHISQIPTPNMILLQKLDDERIKQQIRNAFPKANEDSVSRAFTMIKAQNLNS